MRKGTHHSEETKRKLCLARKGFKPSPESNTKRSATLKGRTFSLESKRKMSLASIGRKCSLETRKKVSEALKGRKISPEVRKKMSEGTCKAIQEGRVKPAPKGISGDFVSHKNGKILHYRSLLELHWYQLLEKMSVVQKYSAEPVIIPYQLNGSTHHYIPDLRIRYTDGTTELLDMRD